MSENFLCQKNAAGTEAVISVSGEIGHENITMLEGLLEKCLSDELKLITVDLRGASFLPSICFGLLITSGEDAISRGCAFRVIMKPHAAHLARSIGVGQIVELIEDSSAI